MAHGVVWFELGKLRDQRELGLALGLGRLLLPSWTVGALGGVLLTQGAAPRGVVGLEAGYRVPLDRLGLPSRYSGWVEAWGLFAPPVAGQGVAGAAGVGLRAEF